MRKNRKNHPETSEKSAPDGFSVVIHAVPVECVPLKTVGKSVPVLPALKLKLIFIALKKNRPI